MKKLILLISVCITLNYSLLIQNCSSQWVQVSSGISANAYISDIEVCGPYIFAGTASPPQGVYRSSDNGSNWKQCLAGRSVNSLGTMGTTLFAGAGGIVFRSSNYGASWDSISTPGWAISSLASSDMYLFVGTADYHNENHRLLRSADSGKTWVTCLQWIEDDFSSIAANGSNIFAGSWCVYRSTNFGSNWELTFREYDVRSLAANNSFVYAGTRDHGVYLSQNNGLLWQQTSLYFGTILSLAVYGTNFFAGTQGLGVYFVFSNGSNWTLKNDGFITTPTVNSLLIADGYVFAGTQGQSVWRRPLSDFVGIKPMNNAIPEEYLLYQNYPNPFNPATTIRFSIPPLEGVRGRVIKLKVYDILGSEDATLVNEPLSPGTYEVEWDGTNYPSGVYLYKLTVGDFIDTKRMILVK